MKHESCPTTLIAFANETTGSVDNEEEDGAVLHLEVHGKRIMSNRHKLLQEKFKSILGKKTSVGRVELGPGEGMEISFLG